MMKFSSEETTFRPWLPSSTTLGGGVLNFVYPDFRQETAAFVWRHDEHKAQR
jgi:hypothetical protein